MHLYLYRFHHGIRCELKIMVFRDTKIELKKAKKFYLQSKRTSIRLGNSTKKAALPNGFSFK
jgi:hypothetical protein